MKLREALIAANRILNEAGVSTARIDAEVLMQHVLQKEKIFLITEPAYEFSAEEEKRFFETVNERASGKPVSYITGEKEFMGLPFTVNEAVLIPRPDTEILTEEAVRLLKDELQMRDKLTDIGIKTAETGAEAVTGGVKVLDMCTGSGAIAVSIAYYVNRAEVTAADISGEALEVAGINAEKNDIAERMTFVQGNLFENIDDGEEYDMIVSNPPYIKTEDVAGLMTDVKDFEPELALDGGDDGLDFYRIIIPEAEKRLKKGGYLLFEIGMDQGDDLRKLFAENGGFEDVRVLQDLAGLDRTVCAKKK